MDDRTSESVSRQCKQSKATINGGPLSISSSSKHFGAQASVDGDWGGSFEESLLAPGEQRYLLSTGVHDYRGLSVIALTLKAGPGERCMMEE